ncbi:MAG: hypothetical protein RLY84_574, partial [Actinomycetota bacterium]
DSLFLALTSLSLLASILPEIQPRSWLEVCDYPPNREQKPPFSAYSSFAGFDQLLSGDIPPFDPGSRR